MTKADFDARLNKATTGDLEAMRDISWLCFKMEEGGRRNNDIAGANMYRDLGNDWKALIDSNSKDSAKLSKAKTETARAFDGCF